MRFAAVHSCAVAGCAVPLEGRADAHARTHAARHTHLNVRAHAYTGTEARAHPHIHTPTYTHHTHTCARARARTHSSGNDVLLMRAAHTTLQAAARAAAPTARSCRPRACLPRAALQLDWRRCLRGAVRRPPLQRGQQAQPRSRVRRWRVYRRAAPISTAAPHSPARRAGARTSHIGRRRRTRAWRARARRARAGAVLRDGFGRCRAARSRRSSAVKTHCARCGVRKCKSGLQLRRARQPAAHARTRT